MTSTIGVAIFPLRRLDVQVHIGVHAEAPFLHIAIGDAQIIQQQLELREVRLGFGGRAKVGLANDLQKGRAGTVQIDAAVGLARLLVVHALAGILLQMRPDDADLSGSMRPLGSLIAKWPSRLRGSSNWLI